MTASNPAPEVAATPAVLSPEPPIVPTSGTKRVPDDSEAAVVRDAQQYDWRKIVDTARNMILGRVADDLAANIERLEAERDALLAEHEAWDEWGNHSGDALAKEVLLGIAVEAHDNAEKVIRG